MTPTLRGNTYVNALSMSSEALKAWLPLLLIAVETLMRVAS